jgi:ribosomal protein L11 methyltransferase
MFILTYNIKFEELDSKIELLQINDIFNIFYDSPLEITTEDYGYGYFEKTVETIDLKIAFEEEKSSLESFCNNISKIIGCECSNIDEINNDYSNYDFPSVIINDDWILASPEEKVQHKNKINFISEGAFGTGLHETTRDLLEIILTKLDLNNKNILDIGTGSGILSIASSIVGASKVTALDIRDVRSEVEQNAALNGLYNVNVIIGDALTENLPFDSSYDWIYINIGGEETEMFMNFIKKHLSVNSKLLVSGLVEWSFEKVKAMIETYGYTLEDKYQSKEWVTAIFK